MRTPTDSQARGAAKGGLSGLIGKSKGMFRSWTGGSIASVLHSDPQQRRHDGDASGGGAASASSDEVVDEKKGVGREGAKSPFEDPVDGDGEYLYHEKEGGQAL